MDPAAYTGGAANANLVLTCPSDAKRMIRFVKNTHVSSSPENINALRDYERDQAKTERQSA